MKHILFNSVAICFVLFLFACKSSEKPETIVFRDFNLDATVEKMNVAQLKQETGGNSDPTVINFTNECLRSFEIEYLVDEQNSEQFNETVFPMS